MIKLTYDKENSTILTVDNYQFEIPFEFGEYLKKTNGLTEDNIEVTCSKTGVVTLKIKSLTYKLYDKKNEKVLSLYKSSKINKGVKKTMRFYIKFMPNKIEGKTNPFNSLVLKIVKPALSQKEFTTLDEAQDAISKALDELRSENSEWVIEKNNKIEGLVVKNTYKRPDKEFPSHNIFFVNVVQPKDAAAN